MLCTKRLRYQGKVNLVGMIDNTERYTAAWVNIGRVEYAKRNAAKHQARQPSSKHQAHTMHKGHVPRYILV